MVYGDHYIPHDGDRESLWLENGTKGVMEGLCFRPNIVERPRSQDGGDLNGSCRLPHLSV